MSAGRFWLISAGALALIATLFLFFYQPKGWKKNALGGALAAFLLLSLWYHMPIICRDHVQVVETNTQKQCVIELELIVRRSYLHGTEISGWFCTPMDTYGASWIGEATRENGRYRCNTMFRADTMAQEPSFENTVDIVNVDFSRGFEEITCLSLIERRQGEEWYWYETPAKP